MTTRWCENGKVWNEVGFIVPIKVEQINVDLFLDTYDANKIKIGVNEMRMNETKMSMRWSKYAWLIKQLIFFICSGWSYT